MPEIVLNKLKHINTTSQVLFFHPHFEILFLCILCYSTLTPTSFFSSPLLSKSSTKLIATSHI